MKKLSLTIFFVLLSLLMACTSAVPMEESEKTETLTAKAMQPEDSSGRTFYFAEPLCLNAQINMSSYSDFIPLAFQVLEDGRFLINGEETSRPEEILLTEENFDEQFMLDHQENAAIWRSENERAWSVWYRNRENFVVMEQRDGSCLVAWRYGENARFSHVFLTAATPKEGNGKILWYGPEKAAEIPTSTDLRNGAAYISTECLSIPFGGGSMKADSMRYYTVEKDAFVRTIRWWREERGRSNLGDRIWQPLPWTEEMWREKPYYEALEKRFAIPFGDWRYMPLEGSDDYLLSSGDLLILWNGEGAYRLEQMDGIGPARWAYMEKTDWQHLPVELSFMGEYDELRLFCEGGSVEGVFVYKDDDRHNYNLSTPDNKNIIYWTPMNEEGSRDDAGVIHFTLLKSEAKSVGQLNEDDIFLTGTITLKLRGTKYKSVKINIDGEKPKDLTIKVLDYEGNLLKKE